MVVAVSGYSLDRTRRPEEEDLPLVTHCTDDARCPSPDAPPDPPGLRATIGHAARHVIDGVIVPVALFYGGLRLLGLVGAIIAALAWGYGALIVRLVLTRKVPVVLLVTLVTLTVRSIVGLSTGSAVLYFLQPTLGTLLVALAFLVSVSLRKPLAERVAHEFVPLPQAFATAPWVRRFFVRISLLWAMVFLANFAVSLWLLVTQTLEAFLIVRTSVSLGLTGLAIVASTLLFFSAARWHGLQISIGDRTTPAEASA
jgi:intracellular septation protein A